MDHCSYWDIEGLVATNADLPAGASGNTVLIDDSDHINLRDLVAARPNRYGNFNGIAISGSHDVSLEDSEVYDFHRTGVALFKSTDLAVRRLYINGRGYADIAGGYVSQCPQTGDQGVHLRYVGRSVVDTVISEGSCIGVEIFAGSGAGIAADSGWGDNNVIRNSIALGIPNDGAFEQGFEVYSDCATCAVGDEVAANNRIERSVAIGFVTGFWSRAVGTTFDHVTAHLSESYGVKGDGSSTPLWGLVVTNASVATAGTAGFLVRQHLAWSVDASNSFASTVAYDTMGNVTSSGAIDPMYGACWVYPPLGSPLQALGRGADLRSIWTGPNQTFPCGAPAPGVSDDPTTSCAGIHERLRVGADGCAAP